MCTDRPNNEGKINRETQFRNTFPFYKPDGRDFKEMHNLIPLAVRIQVHREPLCKNEVEASLLQTNWFAIKNLTEIVYIHVLYFLYYIKILNFAFIFRA